MNARSHTGRTHYSRQGRRVVGFLTGCLFVALFGSAAPADEILLDTGNALVGDMACSGRRHHHAVRKRVGPCAVRGIPLTGLLEESSLIAYSSKWRRLSGSR